MRPVSDGGDVEDRPKPPSEAELALNPVLDPLELLDLAFDAMLVRSFKGRRIVFWNHGAERLYGWSGSEALGQIAGELLQSEYPMPLTEIEHELATKGTWEGIFRQRHRNGHGIMVLARWVVHRDAAGEPDGILEINTDISRQMEFEARLGASEEMFRLLVSGVQDYAIFMLDVGGHVASWNEGAARIKGYKAEDIIGQHFSVFYPEVDKRSGKPEWELVVATETGRFEDEGWRVRKDGSLFWANVVITALRDSTGRLHGFGKVTRDLTARREAEMERLRRERAATEAARQHAARLGELERAKTEFLNLASHELRGPLAIARGYVSMLLDGSLSAEAFAKFAPIVEWKLSQIELLVQKMLETARLEYDQLAVSMEELDIRSLVDEQVEAAKPMLTPAHELRVSTDPGAPVLVRGDRDRLATVVLNLIDNAIKYSPSGGVIEIKVAVGRERAFVAVSDEGVGIDPEDMPRLFKRFSRLDDPDTTTVSGTGLGLYLAREIARRHGGDIIVESRPRHGSRFTLSLPLARSRSRAGGGGRARA